MTILELKAELFAINTDETVAIAENLSELPPYFTAETLRRVNAAFVRGIRLVDTLPETYEKDFEIIS